MTHAKIQPDPEDFERIQREPGTATTAEQMARHYRLAQAAKLIRLFAESAPETVSSK